MSLCGIVGFHQVEENGNHTFLFSESVFDITIEAVIYGISVLTKTTYNHIGDWLVGSGNPVPRQRSLIIRSKVLSLQLVRDMGRLV